MTLEKSDTEAEPTEAQRTLMATVGTCILHNDNQAALAAIVRHDAQAEARVRELTERLAAVSETQREDAGQLEEIEAAVFEAGYDAEELSPAQVIQELTSLVADGAAFRERVQELANQWGGDSPFLWPKRAGEMLKELLASAPTTAPAGQAAGSPWVAVEDVKPANGQNVMMHGVYPSGEDFWFHHGTWPPEEEGVADGVTHWLAIPPPPRRRGSRAYMSPEQPQLMQPAASVEVGGVTYVADPNIPKDGGPWLVAEQCAECGKVGGHDNVIDGESGKLGPCPFASGNAKVLSDPRLVQAVKDGRSGRAVVMGAAEPKAEERGGAVEEIAFRTRLFCTECKTSWVFKDRGEECPVCAGSAGHQGSQGKD